MGILRKLFEVLVTYLVFDMCYGLEDVQHSLSGSSDSGGLRSPTPHYCNHKHAFHDEDNHHHHHNGHDFHRNKEGSTGLKLPEELAEEEDLQVYGLGIQHEHDHDSEHELEFEGKLHGVGLWVRAIGCSLLVSMASLICLIILPLIFIQGKPSKLVVDSLAVFGAGAMLGDAFLHQLPHAFGGENSNSHNHDGQHMHHHHLHTANMHSHSLKDLSVGLSILAGIVVFLLVEKAVRFVEGASVGGGHGHHHHLHKKEKKLKDDGDNIQLQSLLAGNKKTIEMQLKENISDGVSGESLKERRQSSDESYLRKRNLSTSPDEKSDQDAANCALNDTKSQIVTEPAHSSSNLVFGYLNLFSDGVHNFTDGMALGSAFLLHGSLGGWSRTLFLLAHELPQEVGDFGILVRSGFSVPKALFFNFLSALAALLGTALALLLGQDPGQSWLIEGFTAGGFIYIAVAGVLAEMNGDDDVTVKGTAMQLSSLILGAMVALCISLIE